DCSRQLVPFAGLNRQLPPPLRRQPVELRSPVVLRDSRFDRNPSSLDQPVQRRIQRSLLDLQHIVGVELDCLCNGVPVRRPQQQRTQNQQVQGPLQQLDPLFSRPPR